MSLFELLVGVVAPPACVGCGQEGSALCRDCSGLQRREFVPACFWCGALGEGARTCPGCRRRSYLFAASAAGEYTPQLRALVRRYKFDHQRVAVAPMAALLAERLKLFVPAGVWVTGVPSATTHVRRRSFDHGRLLARATARGAGYAFAPVLRRTGQQRQVGANRERRLKQLKETFYVPQGQAALVAGRDWLVVDDISTTGASLNEAARALKAAGGRRVFAVVLAKKDKK